MHARIRTRMLCVVLPAFVVLTGRNAAWAANGSWNFTTEPDAIEDANTAVVLQDGRVLVVGNKFAQMTAEIYDPATATWTRQADPILLRYDSPAVLLGDGRVLIVGGDIHAGNKAGEVFDPSTGS